jgi:thiamine pyrophosphokinase
MTSSYSSLDSLPSPNSGRLLTVHLEKEQSIIWPALVVGPVAETLSPYLCTPAVFNSSQELEHQYNMDPTSLVLIGLELFDIRKDKEEAFECFVYVNL